MGTMEVAKEAGFLESAIKAMSMLRPSMSYDPNTGSPTFSFTTDSLTRENPDTVEFALKGLEELAKKRKIAVHFDEFQAVLKSDPSGKALALMRSRIQFHDKIPYVFSGSDRSWMVDIFTSPDSPFYKSAQALSVRSLEGDVLWEFIGARFKKSGFSMTDDFRSEVVEMRIARPGDVRSRIA